MGRHGGDRTKSDGSGWEREKHTREKQAIINWINQSYKPRSEPNRRWETWNVIPSSVVWTTKPICQTGNGGSTNVTGAFPKSTSAKPTWSRIETGNLVQTLSVNDYITIFTGILSYIMWQNSQIQIRMMLSHSDLFYLNYKSIPYIKECNITLYFSLYWIVHATSSHFHYYSSNKGFCLQLHHSNNVIFFFVKYQRGMVTH